MFNFNLLDGFLNVFLSDDVEMILFGGNFLFEEEEDDVVFFRYLGLKK